MDEVVDEIQDRVMACAISAMPKIPDLSLLNMLDEAERIAEREAQLELMQREILKRKLSDKAKAVMKTYRPTKQRLKFNRARRGWR